MILIWIGILCCLEMWMDIVINVFFFFFFWIEENFSNFTAKSEVFSFANNEHE